jgi:hypothetical protein
MDGPIRCAARVLAAIAIVAGTAALFPIPVQAAQPVGSGGGGVVPLDPGWVQDPTTLQMKLDNRFVRDATGKVEVLAQARTISPDSFAPSLTLNTAVTGLNQEPKGQYGTDDAGGNYYDYNYWKFCGPGATSVPLYYWPYSTWNYSSASYFNEPVNRGYGYYYYGYWNSNHAHFSIMDLAEYMKPAPDNWPYRGLMLWQYSYTDSRFGTPIDRIHDVLNYEITNNGSINGWYAYVPTSISLGVLQFEVEYDITYGVPLVVAAQTYWHNPSTGVNEHLPQWTHAIWHYVSVVGYNNNSGTFTIIDTCGPSCSDQGPYGVGTVPQSWLDDLINQIPSSSGGGIVW